MPSKAEKLLPVLLVVGGAAWLLLSRRGQELLAGLGGRGQSRDTLAPIIDAVAQPIGRALNEVVQSGVNLRDPQSEERKGFAKLGKVFSTGGDSDERHSDQLKRQVQASYAERVGAEQHAQRVFAAASQAHVSAWQIDSVGTWSIWYRGREVPHRIAVPARAINAAAWALEPAVRVFGDARQQGQGPLPGPFPSHVEPSFSDANPYAPTGYRRSEVELWSRSLGEAFVRDHPRSVTPNSPAQFPDEVGRLLLDDPLVANEV